MMCQRPAGEEAFFVKLPSEIRDTIYYHAYLPATIAIHTNSPWEKNKHLSTLKKADMDTLFMSKRFYKEAWRILFLYAQFIAPVNVHQTLALNSVSHLGPSTTGPILTVPSKNLNAYKNPRHIEFKIEHCKSGTDQFNLSVIAISPIAEILPKLSQLQTIAITWREDGIHAMDLLSMLALFEDFQKSHTAVEINILGPRYHARRIRAIPLGPGPGYGNHIARAPRYTANITAGLDRVVLGGTIPGGARLSGASGVGTAIAGAGRGGTGSGTVGHTPSQAWNRSGQLSLHSSAFGLYRNPPTDSTGALAGQFSEHIPLKDFMGELKLVVHGKPALNAEGQDGERNT